MTTKAFCASAVAAAVGLASMLACAGGLWAADPATTPAAAKPVVVYTRDNAPKAPQVEEMPTRDSISQFGITWTFARKVPVGQFLTGDFYVVGPVEVVSVSPAPVGSGKEFRNGSMFNPPVTAYSAYDGRFHNTFRQDLAAKFPLAMKPGDSLISTISLDALQKNRIIPDIPDKAEDSPIKTAAILTCLAAPVPADTFRPGYCDPKKDKFHRASEIRWDLLPAVKPAAKAPATTWMNRMWERPWIDHVFGWASRELHPSENMPGYGREVGRCVSFSGLYLCCDYPPEQKAPVCYGLLQYGIDNWAIAQRGKRKEEGGWPAAGGYGNGRKMPIIFAAVLLQDKEMLAIAKNAPETAFGEDEHTEFGPTWTGAKVRFTGQYPEIGDKQPDRGPYEHLTPDKWPGNSPTMSEGYRRCCTAVCWIGQALAVEMLHAEKVWDHDAFFAYVDRWMTEDDSKFNAEIEKAHPKFKVGVRQGSTDFDPWIDAMWKLYRNNLPPAKP